MHAIFLHYTSDLRATRSVHFKCIFISFFIILTLGVELSSFPCFVREIPNSS
jgi:hypothetical protein